MMVLCVLAAVIACLVFLRKPKSDLPSPVRHFDVRQDGPLWVFTVRPSGLVLPAVILAAIPGAAIAILVTASWLSVGHDLNGSGGFFFSSWLVFTALAWVPMRRRAQAQAEGVSFSVGVTGILLSSEQFLPILGQYVLTRRVSQDSRPEHAHRVDIDVDGVSYTLAGGMGDQQSMALYHEVGRRLRGDP